MLLATMTSGSDDLYSLVRTLNVTLATTIDDVIGNTTSPTAADVFRTVTFLLFLITGFTLNCIQISVILQSNQLRSDRFNVFLISLAAVNLIDCLGNIPSTALDSHSRNGLWDHENALFTIDCIIVYLVGMVTVLGLLFMVADRLAEFQSSMGLTRLCSDTLTPLTCVRMMVVYSWIHGTILVVPFTLPALASSNCPGQTCQGRLGYLWTMAFIGFVIPVIVLCCLYGYVIYTAVQQSAACQAYASENTPAVTRSSCLPDLGDFKYLAWLTVAWVVLQVPLLISRFTVLAGASRTKPHEEVILSSSFELGIALRWLFVAYAMLLPVLTYCWRRNTCQKLKVILSCHKTNIVVDSSPNHHGGPPQPSPSPVLQRNPHFAVPVLFATANGLHVQMTTTKGTISPGVSPAISRKQWNSCSPSLQEKRTKQPEHMTSQMTPTMMTSKRCDVFGSINSRDILSDDGNTSECDSSYDCNFFILQSNNPNRTTSGNNRTMTTSCNNSTVTTSCNRTTTATSNNPVTSDDNLTSSPSFKNNYEASVTDDQKNAAALKDNSEHSKDLVCRSSTVTAAKPSPLRVPAVAPDIDSPTEQKTDNICYLDTGASKSPDKRCNSYSGLSSVETAPIEGNESRLSTQGKQNTGPIYYATETHDPASELHRTATTFDPNSQETPGRKKGRKKRKQLTKKLDTNSEGKAEVTADSRDSTIITTNTQRKRIERGADDSEPASVEETRHAAAFKAETNNNELKTMKVKRNRLSSESSNNLLDSSSTSSEFSILQSAYHHA